MNKLTIRFQIYVISMFMQMPTPEKPENVEK